MRANPLLQAPPALTVLAVCFFVSVLLGREASITEDLPVFFPDTQDIVYVELCGEGLPSGIYQFYDGLLLRDVIILTSVFPAADSLADAALSRPIQSGESFRLTRKEHKIGLLEQGWMPASHRMTMSIPLHPDHMSLSDWQALPGAGEILAEKIEADRQINGDFGNFKSLIRVKGIGEKRLKLWKEFFEEA